MKKYIVGAMFFVSFLLEIVLIKIVLYPQLTNIYLYISAVLALTLFYSLVYILSTKNAKLIEKQEAQIKDNKERIVKLTKQLEDANKEIKARDEFLSIASHELKTPLSSMLLQIQSILHSIHNVSLAEFSVANLLKLLESAQSQTQRLSKLLNDLLNVSLITTGRMEIEPQKLDLSQLVKDVSNHFAEKLEQDKIQMRIDAQKPVIGNFDKLRLEQAVSNLLTNAIKYGNNKPIEILVGNSNNRGRIIVKDHGIGIPKEKQEKIFARFERAVDKKDYQGLGVGLYITNQIVKAHHGDLFVKSKVNHGSTFEINLPLN